MSCKGRAKAIAIEFRCGGSGGTYLAGHLTRRSTNSSCPSLFTMRAKKAGGGKNDEPQPEVPSTAPESDETSTEVDIAHLQAIMSGSLPEGNTNIPPIPGSNSGGQGPTGNNNGGNR